MIAQDHREKLETREGEAINQSKADLFVLVNEFIPVRKMKKKKLLTPRKFFFHFIELLRSID